MAAQENIFKQVQMLAEESLAALTNTGYFIKYANKELNDFNKRNGSLGSSVSYPLPIRSKGAAGLNVVNHKFTVRYGNLVVSQSQHVSHDWTAQDFTFYADSYMDQIGKSQVLQLGSQVETDMVNCITGTMIGGPESGDGIEGVAQTQSGGYRFFGDGTMALNSYQLLAQAKANFIAYGAPEGDLDLVLPVEYIPAIIGNGLNQFAINRNNDTANSWELGTWNGLNCFTSNLLPVHTAGSCGDEALTLTVVSSSTVQNPDGSATTTIIASGAPVSDSDAVKNGDMGQFTIPSGLKFTTFQGQQTTTLPVQFRVIADAASTGGGQVTITVTPGLVSTPGPTQNLNKPLVAGMTFKLMPSHKVGLLAHRKAVYMAMPDLPTKEPFPSARASDEKTGVSMLMAHGSELNKNITQMTHYCLYGATIAQDYAMRILLPL